MNRRRRNNPQKSTNATAKRHIAKCLAPQGNAGGAIDENYRYMEKAVRQFEHSPGAEIDEEIRKLVEQRLEESDLSRRNLDVWQQAGMDRKILCKLLAVIVAGDSKWASDEMRNRQDALKRLAKRMKTVARDAQKVLCEPYPWSKIEMWAYLHGGGFAMAMPRPAPWDEAFVRLPSEMEAIAKALIDEQKKFGTYLRTLGRTNPGVVMLLFKCWASCVLTMKREKHIRFQLDHLKELAELLTDAFEFAGKPSSPVFTADSLRKMFTRIVRPYLIGTWLSSLP